MTAGSRTAQPLDPVTAEPRRSVRARFHAGVGLTALGSLFSQGSTFALNLIVANLLGRLPFGIFTVVQGTINTVATLAQVATGYTATKYVAELREHDPHRAARILRLCGIISGATALLASGGLAAAAPVIAVHVFNAPELAGPLRIAACAVLFVVMSGYRLGALAGLECFAVIARVGIVAGVIYLALGIAGAAIAGIDGALAGIVVAAAAQFLILERCLGRQLTMRQLPARPQGIWQERSVILHFALPATLSGTVTLPALWLAGAFLVQQSDGLNQIALFGAANSFRIIVLFLPNIVTNVGMSLLNNQLRASASEYRGLFWWSLGLSTACASIGAVFMTALGPWVLRAFGSSFAEGHAVLRLLMVAAVIEAVAMWLYQVIQSQGRMWLTIIGVVLPRDGLILFLAYALTPRYGAAGLAAAHLLGWLAAIVSLGALIYRIGLGPRSSGLHLELTRPLSAGLASAPDSRRS